jgi:hypothetical protein
MFMTYPIPPFKDGKIGLGAGGAAVRACCGAASRPRAEMTPPLPIRGCSGVIPETANVLTAIKLMIPLNFVPKFFTLI